MDASAIPDKAILTAINILDRQSGVPRSPAIDCGDGWIEVCAGGALALAGLQLTRPAEADSLGGLLLKSDSSLIVKIFERIGWPTSIAERTINQNDACPTKARKERMLRYLHSLRTDS